MIVYSQVILKSEQLPVTLEEVKLHLRVDGTEEDNLIRSMIKVATSVCEKYTGLSFITQTRTIMLHNFGANDIPLPYGPVQSVTSVVYTDSDDVDQTIDSGDYILDQQSGMAKIRVSESWPSTNCSLNNIIITYVAGWPSQETVPFEAKEGVQKVVARMYRHRGDEMTGSYLTDDVMDILDPIKVYWDAEY